MSYAEGNLREKTVPGLHSHLIGKLTTLSKTARTLDLGCGTGAWLKRLSDAGYTNLSGADIRDPPIDAFGITYHKLDLDGDSLEAIEGQYDLITAIEFIEHIGNVSQFLKFVNSRLSPDGMLLVSTPNVNSLVSRLKLALTTKLRHFDQFGDETHFTPVFFDPFVRLLTKHGLTVRDAWTYPENGTQFGSRRAFLLFARALQHILPDPFAGDIMCFLVAKNAEAD
jgi:2-polyprenyl-3-methyl-5-hydroxy-6-metoxy-1,4-benzoquinol methylase